MEFKLQSLNLRIWTRHKNPFSKDFWLKRTFQQAKLFKKEDPDIICLQERIWPVGRFLLRLWKYKAFGSVPKMGHISHEESVLRLPIYVKKSICEKYDVVWMLRYGATEMFNGHGVNVVGIFDKGTKKHTVENAICLIQNCHYSWETDRLNEELGYGFDHNTIACGDFNATVDTFYEKWKQSPRKDDPLYLYRDEGDQPTYISYSNPEDKRNLDHFGVTDLKCKLIHTILPEKTSDHFPISATITIEQDA